MSTIERVSLLSERERRAFLKSLTPDGRTKLDYDWHWWARPAQVAPADPTWRTWMVMAGRGFGKTRAGAEWVRALAESHPDVRIALIGATIGEVRAVMVEGRAGLLNLAPPWSRPVFEASLRRLTWPNGAQAFLYSAAEPETLRGPEHHYAWADEIAKWADGIAVWDNLMLGLRLGKLPRVAATTTPRPVPLIRRLMTEKHVRVTRGSMVANRAHLPASFIEMIRDAYGGTRLGRQEMDGELIDDVEGSLWPRALIERQRAAAVPDRARRTVVGVDPSVSAGGDECGIVVAVLGHDGTVYVVEDASVAKTSPDAWAREVCSAAARHAADCVIAEANNGGEMVGTMLRMAEGTTPVRLAHARGSKGARAEPVAMLYERGLVRHVGAFPALEDQMAGLTYAGGYHGPGRSPDRADALVWAVSELMLGRRGLPGVRVI